MLELFLQRLLFASLVGALPGIERERCRKESKKEDPIFGIRTMILFSILGFVSAFIGSMMSENLFFVLGVLIVLVLTTVVYLANIFALKISGSTTYLAAFLVFFMGFFIGIGGYTNYVIAATLSIATTLILSVRTEIKRWSRDITKEEIFSAIKFGIIAVIIFPILPNRYIDPWNLLNPYKIWYVIVIISTIFFASYILMKKYAKKGIFATSFFSGMVSGTGTVYQLTCWYKKNKNLFNVITSCVFLASFASLLSHLVVIAFVFGLFDLVVYLIIPYTLAMICLLFMFYALYKKTKKEVPQKFFLDSPLSFKSIFTFGGLYLLLLFVGGLLNIYFGNLGLFPAVLGASLVSSSAATASLANLYHIGNISLRSAGLFIIFSAIVSLLIRIFWAMNTKDKQVVKIVSIGTIITSVVLLSSFLLQFYI